MAVITPTNIYVDNVGSATQWTFDCTAVSNGDTLNLACPPSAYWATITSCGATGNSASVRMLASGSTLTVNFSAQAMNLQINVMGRAM